MKTNRLVYRKVQRNTYTCERCDAEIIANVSKTVILTTNEHKVGTWRIIKINK